MRNKKITFFQTAIDHPVVSLGASLLLLGPPLGVDYSASLNTITKYPGKAVSSTLRRTLLSFLVFKACFTLSHTMAAQFALTLGVIETLHSASNETTWLEEEELVDQALDRTFGSR